MIPPADLTAKVEAEIAKDVEIAHGEDWHAQEERHWPDRIERQADAFRKILEFAEVLRSDCRDNDADHLVSLLAAVYDIDTAPKRQHPVSVVNQTSAFSAVVMEHISFGR